MKLEGLWLAGFWYQMLWQILTVVVSKRLKRQPGEGKKRNDGSEAFASVLPGRVFHLSELCFFVK